VRIYACALYVYVCGGSVACVESITQRRSRPEPVLANKRAAIIVRGVGDFGKIHYINSL